MNIPSEIILDNKIIHIKLSVKYQVKQGVTCYSCNIDKENKDFDIAIIHVEKGYSTPMQRILKGTRTIEGHITGHGQFVKNDTIYKEIQNKRFELIIGDTMQWKATESDLLFFEICYPPYKEGRFENIK